VWSEQRDRRYHTNYSTREQATGNAARGIAAIEAEILVVAPDGSSELRLINGERSG